MIDELIRNLESKELEKKLKLKFDQELKAKEIAINHQLLIM